MNAELTAENRPACAPLYSVLSTAYENQTTYEDKGSIQVFVVLPRAIPIKSFGFRSVYGEKVGSRVIDPQRIEEFFESGVETVVRSSSILLASSKEMGVPLWIELDD